MKQLKRFWNEASTNIKKGDLIFLLILVLGYGILAFLNLGDTSMPQTYYEVKEKNPLIEIKLDKVESLSKLRVFTGPKEGRYDIFISENGEDYSILDTANLETVFAWKDIPLTGNAKYIIIEGKDMGSFLGDIQIYNQKNQKVKMTIEDENAKVLIDELDLVPDKISYKNSMYFDEIYFARSAYEYANGKSVYEWVHPPLGKIIQALPIKIHGMSPFTYRMMGTLSGILMIPVLYILAKEMFGKRKYAILASLLLTLDNFHFAQSRMGTVDTHLVLFILTSVLFMFRYLKLSSRARLRTKLFNLGFSGLFIGFAIATKWTGLFAGLGLAILFFTHYYKNYIKQKTKRKEGLKILGSCVGFFVLIPIAIYLISYFAFPNLRPYEIHSMNDLFLQTEAMYKYHSTLEASHEFTSPWYSWSMMMKPVWYHVSYVSKFSRETISGIGNPVIWWFGTIAMIYLIASFFEKRTQEKYAILIMILTLWLPYIFIGRVMFLYHFFPVLPFMILSLVVLLKELSEKWKSDKPIWIFLIITLAFFILFFPIVSGVETPNQYLDFFKWARSWTF